MSKPGFSFGLKKSGPPKPPLASRKKPTPFGGAGDDDGSDDETPKRTVAITELDFDDAPAPSLDDDDGFSKKKSKKLKPGNNPLAPPSKVATAAAVAAAAPPPPPSAAQFNDLSSALTSRKFAQAAEDVDPTIYDYDGVYDSFKAAKAKPKPEDDPANKRPKYFDALQKAADQRERDRQIAEEKRLKREREAEGDEFADKEKFVTEAYKRQLEENRRLEEAEKKREEEEAKKNKNRGMADFYKQMLDREEKEHAAQIKAAEELLKSGAKVEVNGDEEDKKSATERAKEINARGGNVLINDDGEVVDKRQLLKGGLNVAPKKKMEVQQENSRQQAAASSRGGGAGGVSRGAFAGGGGKQAMRERQTRMLEAQLEETLKRSRQEEAEETAKIELASKSRKTEADISSAKERYLARKKAAEEAKKNGLADGPP